MVKSLKNKNTQKRTVKKKNKLGCIISNKKFLNDLYFKFSKN